MCDATFNLSQRQKWRKYKLFKSCYITNRSNSFFCEVVKLFTFENFSCVIQLKKIKKIVKCIDL